MKPILRPLWILALACSMASAAPSLTIYNGHFAVVRDSVPLDLKSGENTIHYTGATSHLEPSSVTLRDPSGKIALEILEQNYRNDPISQPTLLARYEGQTVSFLVREPQKPDRIIEGKVIRSGGRDEGNPGGVEPLIEVDGKLIFELPGRPLFAGLKDDNILKPQLTWKILSSAETHLDAELAYLTEGLDWEASYNFILPESGDQADLNGWITLQNSSGKFFEEAQIKLMAGDVHKLPQSRRMDFEAGALGIPMAKAAAPAVAEKSFDDFHLYQLPRKTTLRDRETKQVEFVLARNVPTQRVYTYSGDTSGFRYMGNPMLERDWNPTPSNKKVQTTLLFQNNEAAQLGIPLPSGSVRVYRKDGEQLEFVGEDKLEHTPRNEKVELHLGNAFDLVGERIRTNFKIDTAQQTLDETFEIRLRNQSKRPVEIQVIEHLSRTSNFSITAKSHAFTKKDSETLVFPIPVASEKEEVLKYTVHYTW